MGTIYERAEATADFLRSQYFKPKTGSHPEPLGQISDDLVGYERLKCGSIVDADSIWTYINSSIPDSEECVVIDVGSGIDRQMLRIARQKPKTKFYLVDSLSKRDIEIEMESGWGLDGDSDFHDIPYLRDPENWMNNLLRANSYNAIYINQKLDPLNPNSNLNQLNYLTKDKTVAVFGLKNPGTLSLATINIANHHRADKCIITPSALELPAPEEMRPLIDGFLERFMTSGEIKKTLDLLHDSASRKEDDLYKTSGKVLNPKRQEKYLYEIEEQKYLAVALKQLVAMALAYRLDWRLHPTIVLMSYSSITTASYNRPDHLIEGVVTIPKDLDGSREKRENKRKYLEQNPMVQITDIDPSFEGFSSRDTNRDAIDEQLKSQFGLPASRHLY